MADSMEFPKTMEEFIDGYSFDDSEKVYTNGVDLIPVYRVMQGFGHYEQEIRNKAIDEFAEWCYMNGIDFSYMAKATDTEPFCKRVIDKFNADQKLAEMQSK
jgi:hypothetical protein